MPKRIGLEPTTTTRDDKDGAAPVVVRHSVARTSSGRPAPRREADQPDGKSGRQCVLRQAPRPVGGGARLKPPRAAAHQGAGNRSCHTDQRTAERRGVSPGQCRTADGTDREARRDGWRNATVGRPVPPHIALFFAARQSRRCTSRRATRQRRPAPPADAGKKRADLEMVARPGPTRLSRPPRRPPSDAGGQDRARAWADPSRKTICRSRPRERGEPLNGTAAQP